MTATAHVFGKLFNSNLCFHFSFQFQESLLILVLLYVLSIRLLFSYFAGHVSSLNLLEMSFDCESNGSVCRGIIVPIWISSVTAALSPLRQILLNPKASIHSMQISFWCLIWKEKLRFLSSQSSWLMLKQWKSSTFSTGFTLFPQDKSSFTQYSLC